MLAKGKVGRLRGCHRTCLRTTPIQFPIEEGKGDDRVEPYQETDAQQVRRRICLRTTLYEIHDQSHRDARGIDDQHSHDRQRDAPDESLLAVDKTWVGDDEGHHEQGVYGRH